MMRWLAMLLLLSAGCASGPRLANPVLFPGAATGVENPVLLAPSDPSPVTYAEIFETTLDVLDDYFNIAYSNRYDGRIETFPTTAPGIVQFWRRGSPDLYERLLASWQTIRYRAQVQIQAAPSGGYLVNVQVFKELEDLRPRPIRAVAGNASFLSANTVERQFDVIDPVVQDTTWIPRGREIALEQEILSRLQWEQ